MQTSLILDLDDTIFQTRLISKKHFDPFITDLKLKLQPKFDAFAIHEIIDALWKRPIDVVFKKYNIPTETVEHSLSLLDNLQLEIVPYPDYNYLLILNCRKFLVTNGITSLQHSKIKALKIEDDFEKIIINDSFKEALTKKDIFKNLLETEKLNPQCVFVIGDNPEAEIEAGNKLNLITIQLLREGVEKGSNADDYIKSFEELGNILSKVSYTSKVSDT